MIRPSDYFYIVGHEKHPYVAWRKGNWRLDFADGTATFMNAMSEIDGQPMYSRLPAHTFVVPAINALIADRFSMN